MSGLNWLQRMVARLPRVRRTLRVLKATPCYARGAHHLWLDLPYLERRYWWRPAVWVGLVEVRGYCGGGEPYIGLTSAGVEFVKGEHLL